LRPEGPTQKRLTPFKILTALIYAETPSILSSDSGLLQVKIGPFSRFIGIPNYRTRDYLMWLESFGYISSLKLTYGEAQFRLSPPQSNRIIL